MIKSRVDDLIRARCLYYHRDGYLCSSSRIYERGKKERELYDSIMRSTRFLSSNSSFSERVYCFINDITEASRCSTCGNFTHFKYFTYGYPQYCSRGCQGVDKITTYNTSDKYALSRSKRNKNSAVRLKEFKLTECGRDAARRGGISSMSKLSCYDNQQELIVYNYLTSLGLKVRRNHRIYVSTKNYYKPDIYVADSALIIEIDGSIHRHLERREVDRRKDKELSELGYSVHRINLIYDKKSDDELVDEVREILSSHYSTTYGFAI